MPGKDFAFRAAKRFRLVNAMNCDFIFFAQMFFDRF